LEQDVRCYSHHDDCKEVEQRLGAKLNSDWDGSCEGDVTLQNHNSNKKWDEE